MEPCLFLAESGAGGCGKESGTGSVHARWMCRRRQMNSAESHSEQTMLSALIEMETLQLPNVCLWGLSTASKSWTEKNEEITGKNKTKGWEDMQTKGRDP